MRNGSAVSSGRSDVGFAVRFGVASLATWRLTHLLAEEDGPGDVVVRTRVAVGEGPAGELMDCFYCLSVWVAAPVSVAVSRRGRDLPFIWLGLSAAACLIERFTGSRAGAQATVDELSP